MHLPNEGCKFHSITTHHKADQRTELPESLPGYVKGYEDAPYVGTKGMCLIEDSAREESTTDSDQKWPINCFTKASLRVVEGCEDFDLHQNRQITTPKSNSGLNMVMPSR